MISMTYVNIEAGQKPLANTRLTRALETAPSAGPLGVIAKSSIFVTRRVGKRPQTLAFKSATRIHVRFDRRAAN
jgi:hypothetical protein